MFIRLVGVILVANKADISNNVKIWFSFQIHEPAILSGRTHSSALFKLGLTSRNADHQNAVMASRRTGADPVANP